MATHQISILGNGLMPDSSGEVYQQPYDVDDTAAAISPMVWVFDVGTAKIGLRGIFVVPQDYVGTAKVIALWNSAGTTNNMVWDLSYLTRTDAEDMGAAATSTSDTVTTAVDSTAYNLNTSTMTLTSGNFAAGDIVLFEIFRDGASDSLASAVNLFDLIFEYADA